MVKLSETICVIYESDEEGGTWAHETKTVNNKVFPLQFTSNYHWADYKLPMETVYILNVELCPL
jgi:hypothetical protein